MSNQLSSSSVDRYFLPSQEVETHGHSEDNHSDPSSILSIPQFNQAPISVKDFGKEIFANPVQRSKNYVISLFPIAQWIYRYNFVWLYSDLIAGITVGAVLVPQGMSYAKIATLPVQYGLYSSFVGVFIYCFFATSKDVSIGPVAVMSLQVSKVIASVTHKYPQYSSDPQFIALGLSLLCGSIALGMGLLRLGFILEYIPLPAVLGFMSGSAFTIAIGQIPGLLGISTLFNTRAATHLVVIHTLQNLKFSTLDAAFGVVSLFILYFSRWLFDFIGKRYPKYERICFFGSILRNALVIIFTTLISWAICHNKKVKDYPISILKTVPSGLQNVGYHTIDQQLATAIAPELAISTIILVMEHIAIGKSFGRLNDYRINPNQELVAIGVTNLVGTFFNAYPATGSFSRTALKSKCGVRTPLAGLFTGAVVLVAIYALTGTFYWISNAVLSAIIIHAVLDLITPWYVTWRFWKTSPLETVVFIGAIFFSVFISLESGIYFSFASCLVFMLLRISFPTGQFLGRVEIIQYLNPHFTDEDEGEEVANKSNGSKSAVNGGTVTIEEDDNNKTNSWKSRIFSSFEKKVGRTTAITTTGSTSDNNNNASRIIQKKYKWVPLSKFNINKDVSVLPPPPGVFVYRPGESFTYPNASRQLENLVIEIRKQTRRGDTQHFKKSLGDRPWNDGGPRKQVYDPNYVDSRPLLRAVVFDFSATPHIDLNGVQALGDIRQELNKYANREVEYHFVGILSPWSRRALMADYFGGADSEAKPERHHVEVARSNGLIVGESSALSLNDEDRAVKKSKSYRDEEERDTFSQVSSDGSYVPVIPTNTPFFHLDIPDLEFLQTDN